ncbi:hypothetical protein niasHT_036255 [Heterodera trifolii]|uniref:DNA2/NAM7 helicase-like C-terminal domain-containing protein n=1 Tax=Heterodera trifolii TaxID=157864 RepID=A0ABD2I0M1_9BILA
MSSEKACGHNTENEMEGEAEEVPAQAPEVVVLDESIEENACGHNTDNENGVLEVMPLANPSDPLGLATVEPVKEMEVDEQNGDQGGDSFGNGGFSGDESSSRHTFLSNKAKRLDQTNASKCSSSSQACLEDGALIDEFQAIGLRAKDKLTKTRIQGPYPGKKEDEKAPKWYLVAQIAANGVIAARVQLAEQWPALIWVDNDIVQKTRPLEVGDSVKVVSVEWAQTATGWAGAGDWLIMVNKRLNHQAVAKEVSACYQGPFSSALGLILYVERHAQKNGSKTMKFATIAAPELPTIMRIQRRHMSDAMANELHSQSLVQMQLVTINRPQGVLISQHYVLPIGFPFKNGDEILAFNANIIAKVEPETRIYAYPFDSNSTWEQIGFGERVMACAVAAERATIHQELQRFTLITELIRVEELQETQVNITFRHQLNSVAEMMDMLQIWEEDTAISCRVDQNDETKPCALGFVRRIEKRALDNGFEVRVEVFLAFQDAKGQKAWEQFEFLREGALEAVELRPMVSTRALRERAELLTKNGCSIIAKDHASPANVIMAILLGRRVPRDVALQSVEEKVMKKGAVGLLKAGQCDSAERMLDGVPRVVFQQAGPGTGKTFTAAAIMAAILREDPSARILAMAPPNIAVCKLVLEMEEALRIEGQPEPMIALFSGAGKINYAEEVRRISQHLLAAAVDTEEFREHLERPDIRKVDKYVAACARNPRLAQETTVARILKEHAERRICFCTLSFAEQTAELFAGTTHLLVDEAGQAPYTQVLSLAFRLPHLRKLLITGDRRQLSVHLPSLPFGARENLGLDTVIQPLDSSECVDVTTLSVSYRSHPSIVRCVETAFYRPHGEQLTPGRSAEERAMLTEQTVIKLPVKDSPIVLIHQGEEAEPDELSRSTSNRAQSDTAMFILWRLARAVPQDTIIRCICLYTAQMLEVARLVRDQGLSNVLVTTADATQGHESALAVVITTVSRNTVDTNNDQPFWAMPNRINVALSRAGHGLVVIGNLLVLGRTPAWRRFIDEAVRETTVVGPDYVHAIRQPNCQHDDRGRLVLEGDGMVRSEEFYARWRGNEGRRSGNSRSGDRRENRFNPYSVQGNSRGGGGSGGDRRSNRR